MTKILIIKLGISETLDPEIGRVSSLGDVLRTTPILYALRERFAQSHITWLVDESAEPLLKGNPLIDRLLVWDQFVPFQLMKERFDVLINLEKVAGLCALSDMIDAWTKYGFRFDSEKGQYHAYERGFECLTYIREKKRNVREKKFWQQVLIEMVGGTWKGQEYIIGYKPKSEVIYDVGFNYEVGSKWPSKKMPMQKWQDLERLLTEKGISISWQEGKNNLYEYMDWINSCRLLISSDSLGLHIGLAFRKSVIAFFGPTNDREIYLYNGSIAIKPEVYCPYMPCYEAVCINNMHCLHHINTEVVAKKVSEILRDGHRSERD